MQALFQNLKRGIKTMKKQVSRIYFRTVDEMYFVDSTYDFDNHTPATKISTTEKQEHFYKSIDLIKTIVKIIEFNNSKLDVYNQVQSLFNDMGIKCNTIQFMDIEYRI